MICNPCVVVNIFNRQHYRLLAHLHKLVTSVVGYYPKLRYALQGDLSEASLPRYRTNRTTE